MTKSILFVDGPSRELRDLADSFATRPSHWNVACLDHGRDAINFIAHQPCDALVADLHLDDISGLQLANLALTDHPHVHRVLMADLGHPASLLRCVGSVHQFLAKPCEPDRLESVLERAFSFQVWLPNQSVRSLVGRVPNLPSPSDDYTTVVRELRLDSPSIDRVASLIALDPPMSAKLLQLANSAAYGPHLDEADPVAAVRDLGLTNTRGALLLGHTYSDFAELDNSGFSPLPLWDHSRRTSRFARLIAESQHLSQHLTQQAATAGLLHDLGKIALAVNLPALFRQRQDLILNKNLPEWEAEQETFGASHAEVAACLLALWNLPPPIIEAVAMHHLPTRFLSQSFSPLTAVHVANAFDHAPSLITARSRLDLDYLNELKLEHRLPSWWNLCHPEPDPVHPPAHSPPAHG